jgi:prevent-host-death family protein
MVRKSVPAGVFKQGCLALLDEVSLSGIELIVTKRGRPVARVLPMIAASERDRDVLSALRSTTHLRATEQELLRPSSELAPWKALETGRKSKVRGGARR